MPQWANSYQRLRAATSRSARGRGDGGEREREAPRGPSDLGRRNFGLSQRDQHLHRRKPMTAAMTEEIVHPDGRHELRPDVDAELNASALHNVDLAPVPIA